MTLTNAAQWLEAGMLLCFGISWPLSILKAWRTKRTEGKSLAFIAVVFVGYIIGVGSKLARAASLGQPPEAVTILYVINAILVGVDLTLYLRYRRLAAT